MTDLQPGTPVVPEAARYRRKGAEVEALHWDGYPVTATVIINWILANDGCARYHDDPSALDIDIPGGWITAVPGNWITRELGGGFWVWDEEAFTEAHEPAGDPLILPPDEFEAVKARLSELENAVSWGTSCLSCSAVLDSAYTETIRRETAEAKLAALRDLCDSIAASVPEGETATVAVSRVLAIIGSEEEHGEH